MNDFDEKMTQYEASCTPLAPPCHEELMAELFSISVKGKTLSGGKTLMPADRIKAAYPELGEDDLTQLLEYLDAASLYCEEVSSCFSRRYGTPFVPQSEQAQQDALRVEKVCRARYPWLSDEQISRILSTVCWLSNR